MSSAATSRTTFLDKASLLLATASPTVSAELRAFLNDDPAYNKDASSKNIYTCKCCGTILIPGWNSSVLRSNAGPRTRQDRLAKKATSKSVRTQCSQCNSITTLESTKPVRETARKATRDKPSTSTESRAVAEDGLASPSMSKPIVSASTEAASRKRSRNNKKSSLQSLLADRNSSKQKTSGLDIMDFMKT